MTTNQIQDSLAAAGKSVQKAQLYRYFRAFKISPLGVAQKPQQYPADSADVILSGLGLGDLSDGDLIRRAELCRPNGKQKNGRVVSTRQLTATAHKSRRTK